MAPRAPDLDVTPLEVFSRVSRLARRLDLARGTAFAEHGLDGWEFDVLSALRRAGTPYELSPGQLVTETLVTSGTMTNRVDRLLTGASSSVAPTPRTAAASSCASHRPGWPSSTPPCPIFSCASTRSWPSWGPPSGPTSPGSCDDSFAPSRAMPDPFPAGPGLMR